MFNITTSISISSYNCRRLPKNFTELHTRPDILTLFNSHDIMFFQETWLAKQELQLCNTLHTEFLSAGVAKVDFSKGILVGRPSGGVSIFYNNRLANYVTPIFFHDCDWCVAIKFTFNSTSFTLFNVYMPYEKSDNEDEYVEKLSLLESFIQNVGHSSYALIGDFNCNVKPENGRVKSKFAKLLFDFCENNSLVFTSQNVLPNDSYTYISESWGTTSWLDHVISSCDFHNCVNNLNIEYNVTSNDHIPISFNVNVSTLPIISVCNFVANSSSQKKVCWKKLSDNQRSMYRTFTDVIHEQSDLDNLIPVCFNGNCTDCEHRNNLEHAYNEFVNILKTSGDKVYNVKKQSNSQKMSTCPHKHMST